MSKRITIPPEDGSVVFAPMSESMQAFLVSLRVQLIEALGLERRGCATGCGVCHECEGGA